MEESTVPENDTSPSQDQPPSWARWSGAMYASAIASELLGVPQESLHLYSTLERNIGRLLSGVHHPIPDDKQAFLELVRSFAQMYLDVHPGPDNAALHHKMMSSVRKVLKNDPPSQEQVQDAWERPDYRFESATMAIWLLDVMEVPVVEEFAAFECGELTRRRYAFPERVEECWDLFADPSVLPDGFGWLWTKVHQWMVMSMAVYGLQNEELYRRLAVAKACKSRAREEQGKSGIRGY